MHQLWTDSRHSLRSLLRSPVLAVTIVATVGLGIGATTLLSSIVHSVLIEPLPYPDSERLVRVYWNRVPPFYSPFSAVDFQGLAAQQTSFERVEGYTFSNMTFRGTEASERVGGKRVTAGYLPLLGIEPFLGRGFSESDALPDAAPTVIISHSFWVTHLGGNQGAIGATVRLDDVPHTVVGVLPPAVGPLDADRDFFVPTDWGAPSRRGPFFIHTVGRLRPGVAREAAAREAQAINERLFPVWQSTYTDRETRWGVVGLKTALVGNIRITLLLALMAVALVLIIASSNAASLLIARALQRRPELAIRGALGASRARLIQHLLTESALLTAGALAVGLALTAAGLQLVRTHGAPYLPRAAEIALNGPTMAILVLTAALSTLLIGLLPSLAGSRSRLSHSALGSRSASAGLAARRLRHVLVATQVAVTTPLLIAAGLLMVSLDRLERVDLGVEAENVLTAATLLPAGSYPDNATVSSFWDRAQDRLAAVPGVEVAGYSDGRPPADNGMVNNFFLENLPTPAGESDPAVPWVSADREYFEAMGIPLLAGRLLDERDGGAGLRSVVVDEAWSRRFFPATGALGKRFRQGGCPSCPFETVVGIVGTVKYSGTDQTSEGIVYWPFADRPLSHPITQITQRFRYFVIRTAVDPVSVLPALRTALRELDPALPLSRVATVAEMAAESLERPRYLTFLVGSFSAMALLLSVIGLYGVTAYSVQQQSRDIGIRLALGDRPGRVLVRVAARGMAVVGTGLGIGLLAALGLTRYLSTLLFEVSHTDPAIFAAVAGLMLTATLLASLVPARRAAGLDPAATLREQ